MTPASILHVGESGTDTCLPWKNIPGCLQDSAVDAAGCLSSWVDLQTHLHAVHQITAELMPIEDCENEFRDNTSLSGISNDCASIQNSRRAQHRHAGRCAAQNALRIFTSGMVASEEPIINLPSGQPVFADHPGIYLSIAHTDAFALACIGHKPVGVDIEKNDPRPPSFSRFFLSDEEQNWAKHCEYGNTTAVNVLWTRKEAVSKLLGKGGVLSFKTLCALNEQSPHRLFSFMLKDHIISLALF